MSPMPAVTAVITQAQMIAAEPEAVSTERPESGDGEGSDQGDQGEHIQRRPIESDLSLRHRRRRRRSTVRGQVDEQRV